MQIAHGAQSRSFLDGLRLDHGAVPQLGRFLLRADAMLRRRGIWLSFGGIEQLAQLNAAHYASWGRFAPQLDNRNISATSSAVFIACPR